MIKINIDGKQYFNHRVIYLMQHGYVPKLIELGANIIFEVQGPLVSLFKNQYSCDIVVKGSSTKSLLLLSVVFVVNA